MQLKYCIANCIIYCIQKEAWFIELYIKEELIFIKFKTIQVF